MKKILSLLLFIFATSSVFAQKIYTRNDSIPITQDSITIMAGPYRGNIQWQKSLDNKNWTNLDNKTADSLNVKTDIEAIYRAKIAEGTCFPVYSDTVVIVPADSTTKNYIEPEKAGLTLISDSNKIFNGNYIYTGAEKNTDFEIGKVIIDEQTGGTIRRITDVMQYTDTVSIKTDQATMEDLFQNASFKLSTSMVYPTQNLKSASKAIIGKALTDKDGFIHPVEISYLSVDGKILKSINVFERKTEEDGGSLYQHYDWSGFKLYDFTGKINVIDKNGVNVSVAGNAKGYIDEGFFTYDPVFKFEFEFDRPKIDLKDLEINKGRITKFKFYSDRSLMEFKNVFAREQSVAFSISQKWKLLPEPATLRLKYLIGVVPLWIDLNINFFAKLSASFYAGGLNKEGFYNTNYITLGAGYENNEWSLINDIEKTHEVITSNSSYFGSEKVRLDLYPRVEIKFYNVVGPFFEVGPYASITKTKSTLLNWDKSLDLGLDARLGVYGNIIGYKLLEFNKTWNFFERNLWQSPANLQMFQGNNQESTVKQQLSKDLIVYVYDSNGNKVDGINVYFKPHKGTVNQDICISNSSGFASCSWTMSSEAGEHQLEIFIKDGKDQIIEGSKITIKANAIDEIVIYKPLISTNAATNITETSATINGDITSDGGSTIIQRGFYWSKIDETPEADDNVEVVSGTTGSFYKIISALEAGTTYYFVAFTTNSKGTSTGTVKTFKTNEIQILTGTFPDSRDGHVYNWVKIGSQTWMSENLAYLPSVVPPTVISNTKPCYYVYGYSGTDVASAKNNINYNTYGVLYNWTAAIAACPPGWHLPSDAEWKQLEMALGMTQAEADGTGWRGTNQGFQIKAASGWLSNVNGSNSSGFTALPSGIRSFSFNWNEGQFFNIGTHCSWWSSDEYLQSKVWTRLLYYNYNSIDRISMGKENGTAVRCVRD